MRLCKDQRDTVSNYIQNPRASRTTEEPLALNDSAGFGVWPAIFIKFNLNALSSFFFSFLLKTTSSLTVTCVAAGLVDDFRSWMEVMIFWGKLAGKVLGFWWWQKREALVVKPGRWESEICLENGSWPRRRCDGVKWNWDGRINSGPIWYHYCRFFIYF